MNSNEAIGPELAALLLGRDTLRDQLSRAIAGRLLAQDGQLSLHPAIATRLDGRLLIVQAYLQDGQPRFECESARVSFHCFHFDTDTLLLIYRALLPDPEEAAGGPWFEPVHQNP